MRGFIKYCKGEAELGVSLYAILDSVSIIFGRKNKKNLIICICEGKGNLLCFRTFSWFLVSLLFCSLAPKIPNKKISGKRFEGSHPYNKLLTARSGQCTSLGHSKKIHCFPFLTRMQIFFLAMLHSSHSVTNE